MDEDELQVRYPLQWSDADVAALADALKDIPELSGSGAALSLDPQEELAVPLDLVQPTIELAVMTLSGLGVGLLVPVLSRLGRRRPGAPVTPVSVHVVQLNVSLNLPDPGALSQEDRQRMLGWLQEHGDSPGRVRWTPEGPVREDE